MTADEVSTPRKIIIATRPWALPASTMPVIFGGVLATTVDGAQFKPVLFLLSLLGMMLLHSGANILGDISDWKRGLDTEVTPVSGGLVRGYLDTRQSLILALALLAVGSGIGLVVAYVVGPAILVIGAVGIVIGVCYTLPPLSLKYHALGDLAVCLNFGVLGALGSWTVQTGHASWVPAVWAIPIGMLVAGILHANNWRDTSSDRQGGFATVASLLGDRGSLYYYGFLVFGAFALVLGIMALTNLAPVTPRMPLTCLFVLLALPMAWKLWKRGLRRAQPVNPTDFILLDKGTADLNLAFGLLYTTSLLLSRLI